MATATAKKVPAKAAKATKKARPQVGKVKTCTMEQCDKAVAMHKAGKKLPEIKRSLQLNEAQAWGAIACHEAKAKGLILPEAQRTATKITQFRNSDKLSWGDIMVRCGWHPAKPGGFTHGKVRKLYKEGSGLSSEGGRIGHGGRFLLGDVGRLLYRGGDRQRTGMEIPAGMSRDQILQAIGQGIDEKMTRLVTSGKITKAQAATRKAKGMAAAEKAVDQARRATNPVKKAAKKAPAKKAMAATVAKARMAAREAASTDA